MVKHLTHELLKLNGTQLASCEICMQLRLISNISTNWLRHICLQLTTTSCLILICHAHLIFQFLFLERISHWHTNCVRIERVIKNYVLDVFVLTSWRLNNKSASFWMLDRQCVRVLTCLETKAFYLLKHRNFRN